ncbi:hypothetical protein HpBGD46_15210 [Helicobacter pylori]
MSEAESKKLCVLKEGEFFYCDLVGLSVVKNLLLYTSPSPRDRQKSRMPSSA